MKTSEIASICLDLQSKLGEPFTIPPLVRASLPEVPKDYRELSRALHHLDRREREALEPKLKNWLMDMISFKGTPTEKLLFRLRLDNAVNFLPTLAEDTRKVCQVELDLPCSQPEEAICWALTAFWEMTGAYTLSLTAKERCRN